MIMDVAQVGNDILARVREISVCNHCKSFFLTRYYFDQVKGYGRQ
jgi:hypothetical protein